MTNLSNLYSDNLFRVYQKQMHLLEVIGQGNWSFDKNNSELSFTNGLKYKVQVLGLQTADGIWLWAWADQPGGLPDESKELSTKVKEFGEEKGIDQLTLGKFRLDEHNISGHDLSVVSIGVTNSSAYFVCPFGNINVFVSIQDENYPKGPENISSSEFVFLFPKLLNDYPVDDVEQTLKAGLKYNGFEIESSSNGKISAIKSGENVEAVVNNNQLQSLSCN